MHSTKLVITTLVILFAFAKPPRKIAIVFIGDSITQARSLRNPTDSAPPVIASNILQSKLKKAAIHFSNQGRSGFTTVDFLPATHKAWPDVVAAARSLQTTSDVELLFSIMLGTNDSAEKGPNGSPVSPENYRANLQVIIDSLLTVFPGSKIVINDPLWYSENTHNTSRYMAEGLARLQTYIPQIETLVKENKQLHPRQVFLGDQDAFQALKKDSITLFKHENGRFGTFYLHPNEKGSAALGEYWAKAIRKVL
jgi:lysophospholipase L1-like esterase